MGCGDSMVAAIAYSIINGFDLQTLSKTAVAAGSVTASKDGTNTCSIEEALEAAATVRIQTITEI